jgi:hypothetical protein
MKAPPRKARTLSLDKPCKVCGEPVHHTYSGPVEGVCGRCSDKKPRRKPMRAYHRGMTVDRSAPNRRSTASTVVLLCIVMVVGAVAVAFALGLFLG